MKKCIWRRAVAAGVLICMGCVVYLMVGGVAGAVLFSAGLWFVVNFDAELFTGRVARDDYSVGQKLLMLLFNVLGAMACGILVCTLVDPVTDQAGKVMDSLAAWGPLTVFCKALMCGVCMYLATTRVGEGSRLPHVIYGVALFILSGYAHSVAIAGYMGLGLWAGMTQWAQAGTLPWEHLLAWGWVLPVAALGNAAGSFLIRWLLSAPRPRTPSVPAPVEQAADNGLSANQETAEETESAERRENP